jgi:hypothetical protein
MTQPELTPEEEALLGSGGLRGYTPTRGVDEPEEAPRGPAGPSRSASSED